MRRCAGVCALLMLLLQCAAVSAAAPPRVGMKLELASIRGRTGAPIHVNVRLEYNDPQFLEGKLELHIFDALELTSESDRLATVVREGIVLAGQDYEFSLLLPALHTSDTRNWAVRAWFVTEDERIELTSAPGRKGPAEPFDLLMTSSLERSFVMCSASDDPRNRDASVNRRLLQEQLLLQDVMQSAVTVSGEELEGEVVDLRGDVKRGDNSDQTPGVIHHAAEWDVRALPEDPLGYCAFDVVLLSDGGLGGLSEACQKALLTWVRAGGSVAIECRERLQPQHLGFLRELLKEGLGAESDLTLDADGRLLVVADRSGVPILSHAGLGRVILLPLVEDLSVVARDREVWRRAVCFLWKVRESSDVARGQARRQLSDLDIVRAYIPKAQRDEFGIYSEDQYVSTPDGYVFLQQIERPGISQKRYYVEDQQINRWRRSHDLKLQSLRVQNSNVLKLSEALLLPSDIQIVPVPVIAVILIGYVLVVGPVDYFVLGWLRMRRFTWVLFPVVTAAFTLLTIAVAHAYMSSDDTGGAMVITDMDDEGRVVRQTTLETLFFGGRREVEAEQRKTLLVQSRDQFLGDGMYGNVALPADEPPRYEGLFPQNYVLRQGVQQWSPVSLRSLSLEPEGVELPAIDWDDEQLVINEAGRVRLSAALQQMSSASAGNLHAIVMHGGQVHAVTNSFGADGSAQFLQLLSMLGGQQQVAEGIFSLLSHVSPQGSDCLEDLAMSAGDDPEEYVLVIVRTRGERVEVFRRLYRVVESGVPAAG